MIMSIQYSSSSVRSKRACSYQPQHQLVSQLTSFLYKLLIKLKIHIFFVGKGIHTAGKEILDIGNISRYFQQKFSDLVIKQTKKYLQVFLSRNRIYPMKFAYISTSTSYMLVTYRSYQYYRLIFMTVATNTEEKISTQKIRDNRQTLSFG